MEFNWLPLEIQLEIFDYLPVRQVMKIREVCKQWNCLINSEFKIKELDCCLKSSKLPTDEYDFNFIHPCIRTFLDYTRDNRMFSRVKFLNADLHLNTYAQLDDAFDLINSFKFLEEAWFHFDDPLNDFGEPVIGSDINLEEIERKQFVVSLDRLEKVRFSLDFETFALNSKIVLDLPRLLILEVRPLENFTIKYPERLRILSTLTLFQGNLNFSKFTSLTKICTPTSDGPWITASFLEKLPSLMELHLDEFGDYSLLLEPPSSNLAAPRIFYADFEFSLNELISNGFQWPDYIGSPEGSTFIARNLRKSIDNNRQVFSLDYNTIAGELDDAEMFGVMPKKFPKINTLNIIGTVSDPNRLLKFIGQFQIKDLQLERTFLPQWFFEKLPDSDPFIQNLKFGTEPTMSILSDDFYFMIFRLENLKILHFEDCPLSLDFVTKLLRELKSIQVVCFEQPRNYSFHLTLWDECRIVLDVDGIKTELNYEISREEAAKLVEFLGRRLKVNGFVCPRELQALLRQLQLEEQGTCS